MPPDPLRPPTPPAARPGMMLMLMLMLMPMMLVLALVAPAMGQARPAEPAGWALRDGDRVVLVGGTLIERDAEFGAIEVEVARRHPGQRITVRNLGWSGDTVEGVTRRRDNPPVDGFASLVDHVRALEPTVVVVGYGGVEAFDGEAGLDRFKGGLDRLLGALGAMGARVVVVSPNPQEHFPPPMPDPTRHNLDLGRYRDALQLAATRDRVRFVDLFGRLADGTRASPPRPLTGNSIHLSAEGYREAARLIVDGLDGPAEPSPIGLLFDAEGLHFGQPSGRYAGRFAEIRLPEPPADPARPSTRPFQVAGLPPGRYRMGVDDAPNVAEADAGAWADGVAIPAAFPADLARLEQLRAAIVRKDLLHFHRWRPQNETYLFGMRKHEQGKNAAELAAFDPQVAAEEARIVDLSRPVVHPFTLTLIPEPAR